MVGVQAELGEQQGAQQEEPDDGKPSQVASCRPGGTIMVRLVF